MLTDVRHPPAARSWPWRSLQADVALVFALCAVLAWVAVVVARLPGTIAVVWIANGITLACLLSAPPDRTLALLCAAALGNLAGNLAYGDPLGLSLAFLPPNTLEIVTGLVLVRRTGLVDRYAEDQRTFLRVMAAGALLPPLVGATVGAATLQALGFAPFTRVWLDWYVGDAIGAVATLPLGLALRSGRGISSLQRLSSPACAAVLASLLLVTVAAARWLPHPFVAFGVALTVVAFMRPRIETFAGTAVVVCALAVVLALGQLVTSNSLVDHALLFLSALLAVLPAQVVAVAVARQRALSQTLAAVGSRVDDIVVMADSDGVLLWANEAREAYWGVPNREVIGLRAADLMPRDYWQHTLAPMMAQALAGAVARTRSEVSFPRRGRRTMEITLQPAHDEEQRPIGVLFCSTDVTELEASRRELESTADALRASNRSLEQFVRIASHDMREPLNTITQFCGLIEQQHAGALPPDAALYFTQVKTGAARMRQMMDAMLQFVRLDQGPAHEPEEVDLDLVMADVRASLGARLAERHATLEVQPLGHVRGHGMLLAVLLQNLVANAIKFVPPERTPAVRVGAARDAAGLRLTVADNGIGIEAARIAELGTPFRRLHARRKYEGTGLGLAICKRIAEQHGGRIEIESVPGEGSRFSVVLPAG